MTGRYVLMTGASRGLGRALATAFWEAGAHLLLVDRRQEGLDAVAAELQPRPSQHVWTLPVDLADADGAERIVSAARTWWPRVDVLVNNAAIQGPIGPLSGNDWGSWVVTLQVDLVTPAALCRLVTAWMTEQGGGSVINISGGGATSARPNYSAYATAKTGLVRLSETLAEELRPHGIRVNCVAPGTMATEMLGETLKSGPDVAGTQEYEVAARVLGEGGTAMRRATDLCLFLASSASEGVTGKLISALWDPWERLQEYRGDLDGSDIYTLRRIVPRDRGKDWGDR